MVLKNSKSWKISLPLLFVLGLQFTSAGQINNVNIDSVFTKIFDAKLYPTKSKLALNKKKPTIIVSTTNCTGCVQYFTKKQKHFQFIFVLNSESLLEAERIVNYHKLSKKGIYFTTSEYVRQLNNLICHNPTPCVIYDSKNVVKFMDYSELSNFSEGFALQYDLLINKFYK